MIGPFFLLKAFIMDKKEKSSVAQSEKTTSVKKSSFPAAGSCPDCNSKNYVGNSFAGIVWIAVAAGVGVSSFLVLFMHEKKAVPIERKRLFVF